MVRPRDAKIWNEDLISALSARYDQSLQAGRRNAFTWQNGLQKITSVRKDIYQYGNGRIVNLPTGLTKTVQQLCEDVIRGVKGVYPDGYVPTAGRVGMGEDGGGGTAAAAAATTAAATGHGPASPSPAGSNPFDNHHYMLHLKIRSGAYAILMAFHQSQASTLTKAQLIREGQKHCDDEMEANYMAGRPFGAWKGIDTLKSHRLVHETGHRSFVQGRGFRDRPHEYTLTRDGELFVEALLRRRPEARDAARLASDGVGGGGGGGGAAFSPSRSRFAAAGGGRRWGGGSPARSSPVAAAAAAAARGASSSTTPSSTRQKTAHSGSSDAAELQNWVASASVGERKSFKVGKDRRRALHNLCDDLERQHPGLLLTHTSSHREGTVRSRTLTVEVVDRPDDDASDGLGALPATASTSARKRPLPPAAEAAGGFPGGGRSIVGPPPSKRLRDLPPKQAAAEAAIRRQRQAAAGAAPDVAAEEAAMLKRALEESLRESSPAAEKKPSARSTNRRGRAAISSSSLSNGFGNGKNRKKAATETVVELLFSSDDGGGGGGDDSDSDSELFQPSVFSPAARKRTPPRPSSIGTGSSFREERGRRNNSVAMGIDFVDIDAVDGKQQEKNASTFTSSDGAIEIKDSQDENNTDDEPIIINDSQDCKIETDNDNDDDDVVLVEETCSNPNTNRLQVEAIQDGTTAHEPNEDVQLTVLIDDRERNRNVTPRTLRMELTRHLESGALRSVWPARMSAGRVEESSLPWGDFAFDVTANGRGGSGGARNRRRLGVAVERKRVNDLVHRSVAGDHWCQLLKMRRHCRLSILMVEYDTRTAGSFTAHGAQNREGWDAFDTTISCEDDIFRLMGRAVLSCSTIKFFQTKDEQASLRAVAALGLVSAAASSNLTREKTVKSSVGKDSQSGLSDRLQEGGIPWRLAKRVSSEVGGIEQLEELYNACASEECKSLLLSHVVGEDELDDMKSTPEGWSDAMYRVFSSKQNSAGGVALKKFKHLVADHGRFLSTLHTGCTTDEALDKILNTAPDVDRQKRAERAVAIELSEEKALKYFPDRDVGQSFLDFTIADSGTQSSQAIVMRTLSGNFASCRLILHEMEGTKAISLLQVAWDDHSEDRDMLSLARSVADKIIGKCATPIAREGKDRRVLLLSGLPAALDFVAKRPGFRSETKAVVDMVLAELMLRHDLTVIQALRKQGDAEKIVRQLALACLHFAWLVEELPGGK